MMNTKKGYIYNSNFALNVLNLNQIKLATEEDKKFALDYWAKLFKAKTWEELKSMASVNEYMEEAAKTIFEMSADDRIRKICSDREEFYIDFSALMADKDATIAKQEADLADKDNEIAKLKAQIAKLQNHK